MKQEGLCWILTEEGNCCVGEGKGGLARRRITPRMGQVEKGQARVVTPICSFQRACSFSRVSVGRQWVLELDELGSQNQFCHFPRW